MFGWSVWPVSDEDSDFFQLAQLVADLGGPLEVEVLGGVLHLFGQPADGFVEVFVGDKIELPVADRACQIDVVEIRHAYEVAVDGLDEVADGCAQRLESVVLPGRRSSSDDPGWGRNRGATA